MLFGAFDLSCSYTNGVLYLSKLFFGFSSTFHSLLTFSSYASWFLIGVLSSWLCLCFHEWETLFPLNRVLMSIQNGATAKYCHELYLFSCAASQQTVWFVSHSVMSGCYFVEDKEIILYFKLAVISMSGGSLLLRHSQSSMSDGGDDLQKKKNKESAHVFNK